MSDSKLSITAILDKQKQISDAAKQASDDIKKQAEQAIQAQTVQSPPSVVPPPNK